MVFFCKTDNAIVRQKHRVLTYPSNASFCYAINVCGIKLLIFGHHFSVPPTNVFFLLLLL